MMANSSQNVSVQTSLLIPGLVLNLNRSNCGQSN